MWLCWDGLLGILAKTNCLRVRHVIPGLIGRDDFGASQGAKSAHTGSMEATSDAAQPKIVRPYGEAHLWPGASLLLGHIVPRCSLVAPRPDHKTGPPNCTGYVVTGPNLFLFWTEEFFAFTENPINGLRRASI